MRNRELYEVSWRLYKAHGGIQYHLDVFGDEISKREGYNKSLYGIEAVHFYLVHKFHWLPSQVKAMTHEDIQFVLLEEMRDWTLPKEAIFREG